MQKPNISEICITYFCCQWSVWVSDEAPEILDIYRERGRIKFDEGLCHVMAMRFIHTLYEFIVAETAETKTVSFEKK